MKYHYGSDCRVCRGPLDQQPKKSGNICRACYLASRRVPPRICRHCNTATAELHKWYCASCRKTKSARRWAKQKAYAAQYKRSDHFKALSMGARGRAKLAVIQHYGGHCACCGEADMVFLSVDHIEGGGGLHRKTIKADSVAQWLVHKGFPSGYQILCFNCNWAKYRLGACPHQKSVLRLVSA